MIVLKCIWQPIQVIQRLCWNSCHNVIFVENLRLKWDCMIGFPKDNILLFWDFLSVLQNLGLGLCVYIGGRLYFKQDCTIKSVYMCVCVLVNIIIDINDIISVYTNIHTLIFANWNISFFLVQLIFNFCISWFWVGPPPL